MNQLFKALNDDTRREILNMLRRKALTAGQIAEAFNISKPSISHHLDILKQAGWVTSVKEGQYIYYTLQPKTALKAYQWLSRLADSTPTEHKKANGRG
jgi:DNA-binding transcriptional ArsR family regulator